MIVITKKLICAKCGETHKYKVLKLCHCDCSLLLDSRPCYGYQNTMEFWLQECDCGYVSADISMDNGASLELLHSIEYFTCEGIEFESRLAERFYHFYLIMKAQKNTLDAFYALIRAAWCCDDVRDAENAMICRKKAISLANRLLSEKVPQKMEIYLIRLDLMRRSGQFEEVLKMYRKWHWKKQIRILVNFQLGRVRKQDTRAYCLDDVFDPDPASVLKIASDE